MIYALALKELHILCGTFFTPCPCNSFEKFVVVDFKRGSFSGSLAGLSQRYKVNHPDHAFRELEAFCSESVGTLNTPPYFKNLKIV